MPEYIGCRDCDSPNCRGCNIYTLAKALKAGRFNGLMNENRAVHVFTDVKPVVRGHWVEETDRYLHWHCSECKYTIAGVEIRYNYCPYCGAYMKEDEP